MGRGDYDHRSAEVPEADWLEQEQPANPTEGADEELAPSASTPDVDDADRLEQTQAVDGDPDEEYTPEPP